MSIAVKTAEPPLGSLAVGKKPKIKTSLMLGAESKHKLSTLKADLRIRGLSVIEFVIVDIFIGATSAFMSQESQEVKSILLCILLVAVTVLPAHGAQASVQDRIRMSVAAADDKRIAPVWGALNASA